MSVDSKFLKEIDSVVSVQQELSTLKGIEKQELRYYLASRKEDLDYGGNYFVSFNLPYSSSYFGTGTTLSKTYPELQQLNVDEIIVIPIPPVYYSELIDGRTITFTCPQISASDSQINMSAITIYSSTYTGDNILKHESSPLVGDNIAFLFADAINKPYTGFTRSDIGEVIDNSSSTTWGYGTENNYQNRPSAVMYKEVQDFYNTDKRTGHYSVSVPTNYPDNRAGYNYDVPVGFAVLDEGFLVLTHTAITSNFPWYSGYTQDGVHPTDLSVQTLKNIYFTGETNAMVSLEPNGPPEGAPISSLTFKDINTMLKTTAVCIGLPREFYISNNHTWNYADAIVNLNEETGYINFDPVYISELGLYNEENELIAIAKTSEPVEKDYTSVVTFNVNIEF